MAQGMEGTGIAGKRPLTHTNLTGNKQAIQCKNKEAMQKAYMVALTRSVHC